MMCSDAELARKHLVARGIEHRLHTPGKDSPFMLKLAQTGGFASELQVTSAVAAVVGACDGELSVGILIDTVADLLEQDPPAGARGGLPRPPRGAPGGGLCGGGGELSVGILIDTVADLLEQDPSSVRDEVFPALRELIGLGVLRRA
jgi:methyltransferase small domain protein